MTMTPSCLALFICPWSQRQRQRNHLLMGHLPSTCIINMIVIYSHTRSNTKLSQPRTNFAETTASAFSTRHMHCMIMLALPLTFLTLILTLADSHDERDLCNVWAVFASLTYWGHQQRNARSNAKAIERQSEVCPWLFVKHCMWQYPVLTFGLLATRAVVRPSTCSL